MVSPKPRTLRSIKSCRQSTGRGSEGGWATFASTQAKVSSRINDHSSFVFAASCFALRGRSPDGAN